MVTTRGNRRAGSVETEESHPRQGNELAHLMQAMAQMVASQEQRDADRAAREEAREEARHAREMARLGAHAGGSSSAAAGPTSWLDLYTRQRPPSFGATPKPEVAEEWLRQVEHIMKSLHCPEVEWVTLATYTFTDTARGWWDNYKMLNRVEEGTTAWRVFTAAFLEKFFPRYARDEKRNEFVYLRQGSMNISEYIDRFHHLEKYFPELLTDERARVHKFVEGLIPPLRSRIYNYIPATMSDTIETVMRLEKDHLRKPPLSHMNQTLNAPPHNRRTQGQGGGFGGPQRNFNNNRDNGNSGNNFHRRNGNRSAPYPPPGAPRNNVNNTNRPPTSDVQSHPPTRSTTSVRDQPKRSMSTSAGRPAPCVHCSKMHPGECRFAGRACYNCGKEGHLRKDCPQGAGAAGPSGSQQSRATPRVFALEAEPARKTSVVTGGEQ